MNLNIIKDGISLFTRDVQVGGNLYNEEIQKQFGLSYAEAERVKISGPSPDAALLSTIIGRVNENLAIEMRRSLDFYNSTAGDGKINKVYLTGGASKTMNLLEAVSQKLNLTVEIMNPFAKRILIFFRPGR